MAGLSQRDVSLSNIAKIGCPLLLISEIDNSGYHYYNLLNWLSKEAKPIFYTHELNWLSKQISKHIHRWLRRDGDRKREEKG